MRGLTIKNLEAFLDFVYHGETNIDLEDLDGFLNFAEELKLRGLTRSAENPKKESSTKIPKYLQPIGKQKMEAMAEEFCYEPPTNKSTEANKNPNVELSLDSLTNLWFQ